MPDEMRNHILEKNQISNLISSNENQDLPFEVDNYHSLYPLEGPPLQVKLPVPSTTYKATHITSGIKFCLRRLHGKY